MVLGEGYLCWMNEGGVLCSSDIFRNMDWEKGHRGVIQAREAAPAGSVSCSNRWGILDTRVPKVSSSWVKRGQLPAP